MEYNYGMNVPLDLDRERSLGAICDALCTANRLVQDESKIGAACTVAETLDYYPYGSLKFDTTTGAYGGESRKYIGQQYDPATGLSYLNARFFNGAQGQFLSEDPIFLSVGNQNQVQQLSQEDQQTFLENPQQFNATVIATTIL
jgi:RHS repeat-associated protein